MTQQNSNNEQPAEEQTFVTHLMELRDRLLRMVLCVIVIFLSLFYFANDIYTVVAGPLTAHLPEDSTMIAIDVASPFLTPFKLTLVLSVFISMPYILYQFWGFVAPGLYQHERRLVFPLLFSSIFLFYAGMAFAYFVVFPLIFGFFTSVAPEGVAIMTDIGRYLDFVLTIFFAFGIAFEVPIATIMLVWTGATTPKKLARMRPYVIVGAFVIGMLLTPPDIISQTLLAIPMWMLYELGIIFSRFYVPAKDEDEDDSSEENSIAPYGVAAAASHVDDEPVYATQAEYEQSSVPEEEEYTDDEDYRPLTEEEMDAELDKIDKEMDDLGEDNELGEFYNGDDSVIDEPDEYEDNKKKEDD
jgi:sec-independent protein translocase protein TatC